MLGHLPSKSNASISANEKGRCLSAKAQFTKRKNTKERSNTIETKLLKDGRAADVGILKKTWGQRTLKEKRRITMGGTHSGLLLYSIWWQIYKCEYPSQLAASRPKRWTFWYFISRKDKRGLENWRQEASETCFKNNWNITQTAALNGWYPLSL